VGGRAGARALIRVTRRYGFPAAHVLRSPALSDAENRRLYGKCAHPAGHGHDYGVEVTLAGPVDPGTGQIVPEAELDALVGERVLEPFSHRLLNDVAPFRHAVPTGENIAQVIHEALAAPLAARGARLVRVRVVETARNQFEIGEAE
jgi:6-pyruvoyltetrahydropterin/6-carboxytetrahydropterin synthase